MSRHFADRLTEALQVKGSPACVGLDPVYDRLPVDLLSAPGSDAGDPGAMTAALAFYGRRVLEIVAPYVAVVKINVAFFEPYRGPGLDAYFELVRAARALDLIVIGDVKRGDVGHSSAQYAAGQLSDAPFGRVRGSPGPDAVTVSPYLGIDGVKPFLDVARDEDKGVFVLLNTSNESAREVQYLRLNDGSTVVQRIARLVDDWAHTDGMMGSAGFSCVGAVVSPASAAQGRALRSLLPDCLFLVPGFGAQGRSNKQIATCFKEDGSGAIVSASRSVIYAYEQQHYIARSGGRWERCVELACTDFVAELAQIQAQ